jgi:hypothetical protein
VANVKSVVRIARKMKDGRFEEQSTVQKVNYPIRSAANAEKDETRLNGHRDMQLHWAFGLTK